LPDDPAYVGMLRMTKPFTQEQLRDAIERVRLERVAAA